MKHRSMPEPERIARLPHYNGLPVTYTTLVDLNGIPNFKATDDRKVWECKRDGKCSICGEPLDYWIAFMVTEEEAKSRNVYENPNHEECLRYAFNICPWLYYSKAKYSDPSEDWNKTEGFIVYAAHPDRTNSLDRPPKLGIYVTSGYKNKVLRNRYRVCRVGNAKKLEWIEGK